MKATNHVIELAAIQKSVSAAQRKIFFSVENWEGIAIPEYESLKLGDAVYIISSGSVKLV
jgi:hypothetical protein